jgi:hypothetical protein
MDSAWASARQAKAPVGAAFAPGTCAETSEEIDSARNIRFAMSRSSSSSEIPDEGKLTQIAYRDFQKQFALEDEISADGAPPIGADSLMNFDRTTLRTYRIDEFMRPQSIADRPQV